MVGVVQLAWLTTYFMFVFFFSSRRRHTRCLSDWSSDVCSSDLMDSAAAGSIRVVHRVPPAAGGWAPPQAPKRRDRKSVVKGKREELGGPGSIRKRGSTDVEKVTTETHASGYAVTRVSDALQRTT